MKIRDIIKKSQEKHGFPEVWSHRFKTLKYDPMTGEGPFPVRTYRFIITTGSKEKAWKWKD